MGLDWMVGFAELKQKMLAPCPHADLPIANEVGDSS